MHTFNSVCVIGLGYIGLPTAAVFAKSGLQVTGVDVNEHAVKTSNEGKAHIVEVDLDGLLQGVVSAGTLKAQTTPTEADAFIIAVPTPFKENHAADLSFVEAATKSIAPYVKEDDLIVLESTVPPGATDKITAWLEEARPDLKEVGGAGSVYYAAHCPERVLPGRVLIELVQNDRIIGGVTDECAERAQALYETFLNGECFLTNARTAEMAKLSENAFRDVNIAFANELSLISDNLDIDVWELIKLANKHPRVNILQPGPGVGGHCIAVDPWFIVDAAPNTSKLIRTARDVNDSKPSAVVDKVKRAVERFKNPTVACLGLAFKADIDDLRSSPALEITKRLTNELDCILLVVEPNIDALPEDLAASGLKLTGLTDAVEAADILVLLVDHREFKRLPASKRAEKIIVDTRGIWS
ncbi:UDP-N-acetyl-D-mannosamine dehydrogenase [Kordiimonas aquimaris]|uniref:UDP-N-acetyl-D-mannosamine dehydrogenase n=1 Tax=Kordiimonas aquimaris TaxID=707591 RepID=UPI0021D1D099|nr:UDP-N-acetyl-D-mannosamine dehydrogenase [Kordiimonas aquimaris]